MGIENEDNVLAEVTTTPSDLVQPNIVTLKSGDTAGTRQVPQVVKTVLKVCLVCIAIIVCVAFLQLILILFLICRSGI